MVLTKWREKGGNLTMRTSHQVKNHQQVKGIMELIQVSFISMFFSSVLNMLIYNQQPSIKGHFILII